jgi:hypothetical protein
MTEAQQQALVQLAKSGLEIAVGFLPGGGAATALAPLAIKGLVAGYEALMKDKPADMPAEEYLALLLRPSQTQTGDDYVNADRARR